MSDTLRPHGLSPPESSVHGIFQATVLEWVTIPSPGDTPKPGTESVFPTLAGGFFTTEPNREAHDKLNSTHQ